MSSLDLSKITSCVYFVRFGESGPIKIGKSERDPRIRVAMCQTGSPEQLHLMAVILCPSAEFEEASLHRKFKHLRIRGEWFESTPELTNFIAEHATPVAFDADPGRPVNRPVYECELSRWDQIADGEDPDQREFDTLHGKDKAERSKLLVDAVMLLSGHFNYAELARLRRIAPRTVYKRLDKALSLDGTDGDDLRRFIGKKPSR